MQFSENVSLFSISVTLKHIGLGSTLHQVPRSKDLIRLFHKAGRVLSYEQILQLDTVIAEATLKSMNIETGTVIPPNLVPNKFVHYSADNIDILDETLDGKNTFHATQVAAWQRGPEPSAILSILQASSKHVLQVPESMDQLCPMNVTVDKINPIFSTEVKEEWFQVNMENKDFIQNAEATDLAFIIQHQKLTGKTSWTVFNENLIKENPELRVLLDTCQFFKPLLMNLIH